MRNVGRSLLSRLKAWASKVLRELRVLTLAIRHPRTPWYAKVVAGLVVAYAFSPIDLIPDPIPILGYLDDAILLPLGVLLARRLIPPPILDECRREADQQGEEPQARSLLGATLVICSWLILAVVAWNLIQ